MKKFLHLLVRSIILISLWQVQTVQANLLIAPTRITFEDRQRSEQLILINSSEETRTYRISWVEKKSLATGGFEKLNEKEIQNSPTSSQMIRYSPRQVTLKAGEKQVIKIAVRRPKGLQDGEYRSYLKLTALPPKKKKSKNGDFSMMLNARINYSLPVIVRQGAISPPKLSIGGVKLAYSTREVESYIEKQKQDAVINVTINRSGLYSAVGNLIVYWQGIGDKEEKIVARIHKTPIYPELEQAKIRLKWPDASITAGQLRISYQGIGSFSGDILAEKIIDVTPSMFKKITK